MNIEIDPVYIKHADIKVIFLYAKQHALKL